VDVKFAARASAIAPSGVMAESVSRLVTLVEKLANAANKHDLMVLVVTPVSATLDRSKLRELLFPVAKDMGLHIAKLTDFTNGEVALRRDGG
jgi:hypothetical protein